MLKLFILTWLCLPIWVLSAPLQASGPDQLAAFEAFYDLDIGPHDTLGTVYMLEDASKKLQVDDVLQLIQQKDPRIVLQSKSNLGLQTNAYWFFIILKTSHAQTQSVILSNNSALVDYIDAYFFNSKLELLRHEISGDHHPRRARRIQSAKPTFETPLHKDEKVLALFRIETQGTLIFQLDIKPLTEHINHMSNELHFLSVYFGLLTMMIIYHCFMFGKLREMVNFYYACYLLSFGLFQASMSGLSYEFIWGNYPAISKFSVPLSALVGLFFATGFSLSYLRLAEYSVLSHRVGRGIQALAVTGIASEFFISYEKIMAYISVLAIVNFSYFLYIGYQGCRRTMRPAYYFMGAWALFSVCMILLALRNFGIVPNHFVIVYGSYIGSGLEVILLSLGVTDRIQEERRARLEAKEEALRTAEKARVDLERRNLSFERFVPHDMIAMLGKHDIEEIELGQQSEKQLTFLFCDIRSYTKISEGMIPSRNFAFLQAYYQLIAPVIRRHEGMIDKYIGDAILAVFDRAPDVALAAALELFEKLEEFNRHNSWTDTPVKIGIGVHRGPAILGIIGENSRLEGTVIGDAVNLAARLEKLTKLRGIPLLTSQETIQALPAETLIQSRYIGRTTVEGKSKVVKLYEILNLDSPSRREAKLQHLPQFELALRLWENQQFAEALKVLDIYLQSVPDDAAALYMKRDILSQGPAGSSLASA